MKAGPGCGSRGRSFVAWSSNSKNTPFYFSGFPYLKSNFNLEMTRSIGFGRWSPLPRRVSIELPRRLTRPLLGRSRPRIAPGCGTDLRLFGLQSGRWSRLRLLSSLPGRGLRYQTEIGMTRRGKFSVSGEFLRSKIGRVTFQRSLDLVKVEDIESFPALDLLVITGISLSFDEVEDGDEIPAYEFVWKTTIFGPKLASVNRIKPIPSVPVLRPFQIPSAPMARDPRLRASTEFAKIRDFAAIEGAAFVVRGWSGRRGASTAPTDRGSEVA